VSFPEEFLDKEIFPDFELTCVVNVLFWQLRTDSSVADDESPDIVHLGTKFSNTLVKYSPFVRVAEFSLQLRCVTSWNRGQDTGDRLYLLANLHVPDEVVGGASAHVHLFEGTRDTGFLLLGSPSTLSAPFDEMNFSTSPLVFVLHLEEKTTEKDFIPKGKLAKPP
jgi:hypothetical protein